MYRTLALLLLLLPPLAGAAAEAQSPTTAPSAPRTHPPATARQPAAFQPGVWIDWQAREVQVDARVVLRSGALEFLACWPGKEHESIVRFEAAAAHVYLALGLIGVLPGHPPVFDPESGRCGPPAGDLLDISFQWEHEGRPRVADAFDWLRVAEYGRTPLPRPWIFAGSLRLPDGALSSDRTGVGIALVDFPDSLICYSRRYPSRNNQLWVAANPDAIPPAGTPVRLVLRPARPHPREAVLDFRGVVWLDGHNCAPADLADIVLLNRRLDPAYVQTVNARGALRIDERRLREQLNDAGVPADALRFIRPSPRNPPPIPPPGDRPCDD